jgi:PAS domain S-box-containing protein
VLSNGYWEDITEQRNANVWIKYLNTALMNISESIIISNMENQIIYANQQVKALHGYEPEELIGKAPDMMNVNPMSEDEYSSLIRALNEGRTYSGVELSRRKDGTTFICEYNLTPIQGDELSTCVGVQRDITERNTDYGGAEGKQRTIRAADAAQQGHCVGDNGGRGFYICQRRCPDRFRPAAGGPGLKGQCFRYDAPFGT